MSDDENVFLIQNTLLVGSFLLRGGDIILLYYHNVFITTENIITDIPYTYGQNVCTLHNILHYNR